jgi:hypothetical protein
LIPLYLQRRSVPACSSWGILSGSARTRQPGSRAGAEASFLFRRLSVAPQADNEQGRAHIKGLAERVGKIYSLRKNKNKKILDVLAKTNYNAMR